jgi:hypothetical protein
VRILLEKLGKSPEAIKTLECQKTQRIPQKKCQKRKKLVGSCSSLGAPSTAHGTAEDNGTSFLLLTAHPKTNFGEEELVISY